MRITPPWQWKPDADKTALNEMARALDTDQVENSRIAREARMCDLEETFPCIQGRTLSPAFVSALEDMNYFHLTRRPIAPKHRGRLNEKLQALASVAVSEDEVECATTLIRLHE